MKRRLLLPLVLLIAATVSAQVLDRPVAVVRLTETVNIGRRQLDAQLALFEQQLGRTLQPTEQEQILEALMNDELLLQAASRSGTRVTQQEIQNYLSVQRQQWSQAIGTVLSEDQFRRQVEQQTGQPWGDFVADVSDELIKLKFVRERRSDVFSRQTGVSDAEIRSFYEEQATSFTNPAMVSFRHVYVDLRGTTDQQREEARALLADYRRRIRNGNLTFDSLEREALDDPGISADDFGYLLRNDARAQQLLGRAFIDAVFALEEGAVEGVLESNVALHIVRVTDKRAPRILELDDPVLPGQNVTVRQQIRTLLASQKEQEALATAVEAVVAELREEAEITLFEANLPW
ncbi:MAG TPA: peptidyl-prolyl cis-trans isomerase [Spirochaetia bacterium]|nr:peptidyl-prolyl cis-trans isomerase [Spirochaetia bacterium]